MKGFIYFLMFLGILIGPFIFGYLVYLFCSWGAYPYPGDWDEVNRQGIAFLFCLWFFIMFLVVIQQALESYIL